MSEIFPEAVLTTGPCACGITMLARLEAVISVVRRYLELCKEQSVILTPASGQDRILTALTVMREAIDEYTCDHGAPQQTDLAHQLDWVLGKLWI